ncbi:glycosyltransferase family 4 protein [Desulfurobacterium crinifex]
MDRRIKIAALGTRGFPHVQGGVEKHCEELYPRLVQLGCDVTVFVRTPYVPKEKRIKEWKGVKFEYLWCPRKKSLEAITHTFLGVLQAKKLLPDILHIHAVGPALMVPLAGALEMKVIMTHHGPDYERAKWGRLAKKVLELGEKVGVLFSDKIIAISRGIQKLIREKYGKDSVFIPNGVSIPEVLPPGETLKKFGLEPRKYVFTACRFVPEKGLHDLIEAFRIIKNPPFKLVIAGNADHETEYSKRIKKLASQTKGVVLTGFLSGKPLQELFSNAGLFVLPSYYEGLPIALLEALSYRLSVLVTDIPPHREIELEKFRYFELGNVRELSALMVKLFKEGISKLETERYMSMLKEMYNWDTIALKTLEVYKEVCKAKQ